jgi:hypothetical protein
MGHRRIKTSQKEYIIDEKTKIIHKLDNIKDQCIFNKDLNTNVYIDESELPDYLISGYNGCHWCNSENNLN